MDLVSSCKQVVFYIKSQNQLSYYLKNRTFLKNIIWIESCGSVSTLKIDLSRAFLFLKARLVQAVILLSEGVRFMVQKAVEFNFVPTP